jgi:hypothetical protein
MNWIFFARMVAILVAAVLRVLEEYAWPDNVPLVRHRPFCAPSHDEVPVSPHSLGVFAYVMQFSSRHLGRAAEMRLP